MKGKSKQSRRGKNSGARQFHSRDGGRGEERSARACRQRAAAKQSVKFKIVVSLRKLAGTCARVYMCTLELASPARCKIQIPPGGGGCSFRCGRSEQTAPRPLTSTLQLRSRFFYSPIPLPRCLPFTDTFYAFSMSLLLFLSEEKLLRSFSCNDIHSAFIRI